MSVCNGHLGPRFDIADGYGRSESYQPGDEVAVRRGALSGVVIREVKPDRYGRKRYSVRTCNGIRVTNVDDLRPT